MLHESELEFLRKERLEETEKKILTPEKRWNRKTGDPKV